MNKGQESMPIELLLGVTILTFVLIIGFYSYRQVCSTQYDEKVKAGLNSLARTIEQVYQGGVGTSPPAITIDTSVPSGCDVNFESVRIVEGSKDACQSKTGKEECLVAVATAISEEGDRYITSRAYIDIPSSMKVSMKGLSSYCGNKNIEGIYQEGNLDNYCGWETGIFSLKITKVQKNEIEIKDLKKELSN